MDVLAGSADEQHRGREPRARRALGLLLAFVALSQFLPSEPFLTQFLASKGLTKEQVDHDLFSLWIYARLPLLLVIGALAECAGSANVLLLGSACGCFTVAVTRLSVWIPALQVTQLTVAASTAAHTGPQYAVLFEVSAVLGSDFQKHVHWAMAVLLCSNCAAGAVGNAMLSGGLPYQRIWELSLAAQVASLVAAAELAREVRGLRRPRAPPRGGVARPWRDACASFCLPGVADWTVWAVTMHTAHVLVVTFWQLLLRAKAPEAEHLNGYVTAASYLLGGLGLLLSARAPVMSDRGARRWLIGFSVAASGLLLCGMGVAEGPLEFYCAFVAYQLVFRLSAAAATQQVGAEICQAGGTQPAEGSWGGPKGFAQAWLQAGPLGLAPAPAGAPPQRQCVALVINITQALASCVQAAVQVAFERAPGRSASGGLPMAARFELLGLGLGLCCACALLLGCTAAGAARRGRR